MLTDESIARLFEWKPSDPGGVIAVLREGKVAHQLAFGLANLEHEVPNTVSTRFHICSITKTFTGAACALLHHQKLLDLDADVRKYIPELPDTISVRVRNLLNMTSGLRDSLESMMVRGVWYRYPRSEKDLLDLLYAQTTLSFPVGTRCAYTNINFNLAALILERVTGKTFEDFVAESFWNPLGMSDTRMRTSNTITVPHLADPYSPSAEGWRKGTWSFGPAAAGGVVSTIGDLARWYGMFRAGGIHGAPLSEIMAERGILADGTPTNYGLGLAIRPYRNWTSHGHSGGLPGYKTVFAFVPELDTAIIILCNRDDIDCNKRVREALDLVYGNEREVKSRIPRKVEFAALAGRYLDRRSGEPVAVSWDSDSGAICVAKMDVAFEFQPADDGSFHDHLQIYSSALRIEPNPIGRPDLILNCGGQIGRYEPIETYSPPLAQMADAIGLYRCADTRSEAEVFRRGEQLVLRFGPAFHQEAEFDLEALDPDLYFARYNRPWATHSHAVRFIRSGDAVTRMLVSSNLLKDTEFVRV